MDRPRRRAALTLLLLAGCAADEHPLRTKGLRVTYQLVSTEGLESYASAVVYDRSGEAILLPLVDEVQVTLPDWQVELIPDTGSDPRYDAIVPVTAEGALHTFSILRSEFRAAPSSQVTMPLDPRPTAPATVARGTEDLVLDWTPEQASEPLRIAVEGDCVDPVELDVDDAAGTHVFPAGAWTGDSGGSCPLTITVRRRAWGSIDATLRNGKVFATQRRQLTVESTP